MTLLTQDKVDLLRSAHRDYHLNVSAAYDEVLFEISERASNRGSLGKADVGALLFWKRLRADTPWAGKLSSMTDVAVRDITGRAVSAVRDPEMPVADAARRGRAALSALPGFRTGDALASALLVAAAPQRMAVYDRRAQKALVRLELELTAASGRYGRYMGMVEQLRNEVDPGNDRSWTARDVDIALYWLGG